MLPVILFPDPQCPTSHQIILIPASEDLSIPSFLFSSIVIALVQAHSLFPELLHQSPADSGLTLSPALPLHYCL